MGGDQYKQPSPTSGGAIGEGGGGDQYRKPSPTIGGAIGEGGINIGNLPLRVMALSGRGGSI